MTPLTKYYAKIFGIGFALGAGMEVFLIKNQMLAASEAKQRLKELQQEQEDAARFEQLKLSASNSSN
ncbi:MAG: hypothetical protein EXX96DRAFT_68256 [Benjaminiella poitrasii]|nr:MAG: hypothetical protein EXX96DRAFT_68256 [Benjaminiella poitrasii]